MFYDNEDSYQQRISMVGGPSLFELVDHTLGGFISGVIDGYAEKGRNYEEWNQRHSEQMLQFRHKMIELEFERKRKEEIYDLTYSLEKQLEIHQREEQKGLQESTIGNYEKAILHFEKSEHYLEIYISLLRNLASKLDKTISHEKEDTALNAVRSLRYKCQGDLLRANGDLKGAKRILAKIYPSTDQTAYIRNESIGEIEFLQLIIDGVSSEDEIYAIQFFTQAINQCKKTLITAKGETKFNFQSYHSLGEALKLLVEGLFEESGIKVEEAKLKFDNASNVIPRSYYAFKMICESYIYLLEEEIGKSKNYTTKSLEIINQKKGYFDAILSSYGKYLIEKFIFKKPDFAIDNLRNSLKDPCNKKKNKPRLENEYSILPKICPYCLSKTSYIQSGENTFKCIECSEIVKIR